MANPLPEVRPLVTSMPTEGFVMQTGGSARRSVVKNTNNLYSVTGVPGHTHNSSAVLSLSADYTRKRMVVGTISSVWGYSTAYDGPAVTLADTDHGDSLLLSNEDERFDRAIERGIGRITLLPENCQHFIQEPTRSISEIRTIVTAAERLRTMTYIEEKGGWIDADQKGTPYRGSFPDVKVSVFGYGDPVFHTTAPHAIQYDEEGPGPDPFGFGGGGELHLRDRADGRWRQRVPRVRRG